MCVCVCVCVYDRVTYLNVIHTGRSRGRHCRPRDTHYISAYIQEAAPTRRMSMASRRLDNNIGKRTYSRTSKQTITHHRLECQSRRGGKKKPPPTAAAGPKTFFRPRTHMPPPRADGPHKESADIIYHTRICI